MLRKFALAILAAFLFVPSLALAAAQVGDEIPNALALPDQNGEVQSFESLAGEKGLVLVFVRSADWCPYCQVQLIDFRDEGQAITDLGYNVVPISYDAPEKLKAFADKYKFPYTMLSDEGSVAIKDFGILNEEYQPEHFAHGVPKPHVYVINNDKVIQAVLAEEGYKNRPQIEAIVEAINAP